MLFQKNESVGPSSLKEEDKGFLQVASIMFGIFRQHFDGLNIKFKDAFEGSLKAWEDRVSPADIEVAFLFLARLVYPTNQPD